MGFYDNNNGVPTSDLDKIPKPFQREDTGTSIGIMGVEQSDWNTSKDDIIKEVLRNFFVAILYEKLEVIIDGSNPSSTNAIVIDKSHLKDLIRSHFPDCRDVRGDAPYNPRPYYEAITETTPITAVLPTLGSVCAYFKEIPENSTSVIFMRKPYMKVNKLSRNLGNFNGVFICDNEVGNRVLGDMENPEHNEWKAENCNKADRETGYQKAKNARKEFESFITDCLNQLLNLTSSESVEVADLEKYLPAENGQPGKGEKGNPFWGTPTGQYVQEGTSLTTEGKVIPQNPNPEENKKGRVKKDAKGVFTHGDGGGETGGTGGKNNSSGGGTSGPGNNFGKGDVTGENGSYSKLIPVDWRPVISIKKGYMDIVIYVDHDVNDAELTFTIGQESQTKKSLSANEVSIVECSKGSCKGLTISHVNLRGNARNIIQVQFSDHMSHSLNLGVYENI